MSIVCKCTQCDGTKCVNVKMGEVRLFQYKKSRCPHDKRPMWEDVEGDEKAVLLWQVIDWVKDAGVE